MPAVDNDLHQVELHLAAGADINEKTISGEAALHYTIRYQQMEVAELLVATGANANNRNRDGETPPHLAIGQLPLNHNADVNAKSNDGARPSSSAPRGSRAEIVDLLCKHGAKE